MKNVILSLLLLTTFFFIGFLGGKYKSMGDPCIFSFRDCIVRVDYVESDGTFVGNIGGKRKYYHKIEDVKSGCNYWVNKEGKFFPMKPDNIILQQ